MNVMRTNQTIGQVRLTWLLPLLPSPLDDLKQLICSLGDSHEARRLVDLLPSEIKPSFTLTNNKL